MLLLFYHCTTKASAERKGEIEWIYISMIWWGLSNNKRLYSLLSIELQSVRHGSLSRVDSSSFSIIWGSKSPSDWAEIEGQQWQSSQWGWFRKTPHTGSTHSGSRLNTWYTALTPNRSSDGEISEISWGFIEVICCRCLKVSLRRSYEWSSESVLGLAHEASSPT